MKRISALIAIISLLLGQSMVFAEPAITSTLVGKTTIEITYFDAFGVALSSSQTITSTIKTVRSEPGKADITSVTTTTQRVWSSWRGGGLKIDNIDGNSTTTGSDGSSGTSHFWADYKAGYDASGKMAYADKIRGGSHAEERDDNGNKTTSDTVNTYSIKNGEAVVITSVTTGTTVESNGITQISHFTVTTNNSYNARGDIASSTTHSVSYGDGPDAGTRSDTTRTVTYNRNANGVLTGLTLTMSGNHCVKNGEGGFITEKIDWAKSKYTVGYDPQQGYYINYQEIVWVKN